MQIKDTMQEIYRIAVDKGWWDFHRSLPELLMLVVSECAEALELYRDGYQPTEIRYFSPAGKHHGDFHRSDVCYKPQGIPFEMADIVIRVFDICEHLGIDLEAAIRDKLEYNRSRPYRHGGKQI